MNTGIINIKELPEAEQEPFRAYLIGKQVPHVDGADEQDYAYETDYIQWKGDN